MYVPAPNKVEDADAARAMVAGVGAADLVTVGPDGTPESTLVPVLWSADGERLLAHVARANDHWRHLTDGDRVLAIVSGSQAYVSPSWYASKAEHGRVVPTWNYSAVHLTGTVHVHDDIAWLREQVDALTGLHEAGRDQPWATADAPAAFVTGQLRAIVGLEVRVERIEAKAKLSQNRSDADRAGVVRGLRAEHHPRSHAVADDMSGRDHARSSR